MARFFDGTDDEINCGDVTSFASIADCTIVIWAHYGLAGNMTFTSKWAHSTQTTFAIQTNNAANDEIQCFIADAIDDGGQNFGVTTNADVTGDVWTLITILYDGGGATDPDRLKIFKDGTEASVTHTGTIASTFSTGTADNNHGAFTGSLGRFMSGEMAHEVFWNVGLTTNQISALANGVNPFPIQKSSMLLWSPLDGNNSPEDDYTGNGNTGVLTGTTKFAGNPPVELIENYL